jgi:hypothetical protein
MTIPPGYEIVPSTGDAIGGPDELDCLIDKLNEVCRTASLGLALKVGELIIKTLYNGDMESWERPGTSHVSYRALAAREDLLLSASALCRAVSIYALVERLGGSGRWRYITASHFQEVLALPKPEQERFLILADSEHWAVSHLREAIKARPSASAAAGRRGTVRAVRRFGSLLSKHLGALLESDATNVDSAELAELQQRIEALLRNLEGSATPAAHQPRTKSDIVELAPKARSTVERSR